MSTVPGDFNIVCTQIHFSGNVPSPRCGHSCTAISPNFENALLFGGYNGESPLLQDMYLFNFGSVCSLSVSSHVTLTHRTCIHCQCLSNVFSSAQLEMFRRLVLATVWCVLNQASCCFSEVCKHRGLGVKTDTCWTFVCLFALL